MLLFTHQVSRLTHQHRKSLSICGRVHTGYMELEPWALDLMHDRGRHFSIVKIFLNIKKNKNKKRQWSRRKDRRGEKRKRQLQSGDIARQLSTWCESVRTGVQMVRGIGKPICFIRSSSLIDTQVVNRWQKASQPKSPAPRIQVLEGADKGFPKQAG